MSASLVGSEMCIRDSAQSAVQSARAQASPNLDTSGTGAASAVARKRGAVSYTHLTLPTICSV
eukprot:15230734-Alexandrium_andersonii.AAC.1